MRLILGLFMLVGIVLSNGYKNQNVYNIIAPRKPVRFEIMQEILDNINPEIIVYSREINIRDPSALLTANYQNMYIDIGKGHLVAYLNDSSTPEVNSSNQNEMSKMNTFATIYSNMISLLENVQHFAQTCEGRDELRLFGKIKNQSEIRDTVLEKVVQTFKLENPMRKVRTRSKWIAQYKHQKNIGLISETHINILDVVEERLKELLIGIARNTLFKELKSAEKPFCFYHGSKLGIFQSSCLRRKYTLEERILEISSEHSCWRVSLLQLSYHAWKNLKNQGIPKCGLV